MRAWWVATPKRLHQVSALLPPPPRPKPNPKPPQIDRCGCCLVVTTGGTGPAPRDVTPEATEAVCERMLPGYGEQMRAISLKYVPTAVLSRQTAGEPLWLSGGRH